MHSSPPPLDPDKLYRALNVDLQRRIEVMGRLAPEALVVLSIRELCAIACLGIAAPLGCAWWLL